VPHGGGASTLHRTIHRYLRLIVVLAAIVSLAHGAGAIATSAAAGSDPVLLLAGDIAMCDSSFDEATAAILDAHPTASIQTLGDNVYENGTEAEFAN
jgi:hypothetical protein